MGMKMLIVLSVAVVLVASQHNLKGSFAQPQESKVQALESPTVSEVDYVEGPLAPLYGFLIQRRLQRFCKLLRDAGLEQEIQDLGGSWTLFAPTDASFIFLPGGTLEQLQGNPQMLKDFILYHFLTGDFPTSEIQNELLANSVQGSPLRFNIYGQILTVSGAQIIEPDLQFDLGRVHIIDHPLYPIPTTDIVTYLQQNYAEIYRMLVDTGLTDYVSSGTFTFLVPDDDAFSFLSIELKDALAANMSLAEKVLLNHILPGSVYVGGITDGMQLITVGGSIIVFTVRRGLTFANGIPIVLPDVPLTNGVIHVLNRVLLPEGVEADCQCKPSNEPSRGSALSVPGRFGQTLRPQYGQGPTTRRPFGQWDQRQTPRPFTGTSSRTPEQPRLGSQTPSPFTPQRQSQTPAGRPPFVPNRVQQPSPPTNQITGSPYDQQVGQPLPEDDLNTVVGPGEQNFGSQKRPENTQTTRYPPLPTRRVPTPRPQPNRIATQPPKTPHNGQQPGNLDGNYPSWQVTGRMTQPPRLQNRWDNRQSTAPPRYPTPARSPYRTQATTRRQQTTGAYNWNQARATQPTFGTPPSPNEDFDYSYSTENPNQFQTNKPTVKTMSWQQRTIITKTTRQPTQQRTTYRPSRVPPPLQRRPVPRPVVPATPSSTNAPFESNRQKPSCRRPTDWSNRDLPICQDPVSDDCQKPPYSPSDPRPLCPQNNITPECRQQNEPFSSSDNRPLCPSPAVPSGSDCRVLGQPTYAGDQRPFCSPAPQTQTGCRDPSAPYNPSDNRPLCRTTGSQDVTPVPLVPEIPGRQDCRNYGEPFFPQDNRPQCPEEPQEECRSFLERPKPGDRRPVCKVNRQPPPPRQKPGPQKPVKTTQPPRQPNYPQRGRYPTQQTTRRPWQPTTQAPRVTSQPDVNPPQPVGKQPQPSTGVKLPTNQPQAGSFQSRPQSGSYPSVPNAGYQPPSGVYSTTPVSGSHQQNPSSGAYPAQPQTGLYPPQSESNPPQPQPGLSQPHSASQPSRPQSPSYPSQPDIGRPPAQPQTGSYPRQTGTYPSQPQPGDQSQPGQTQPGQSQPGQPQPDQPQLAQPQPGQPQPGQPQPGQPQLGQPQFGLAQPRRPQSDSRTSPRRPTTAVRQPASQFGFTGSSLPRQTPGTHACVRCPNQQARPGGSSDVAPNPLQTGQPGRRPANIPGQQVGSFTPTPGRGSGTPRIPTSVAGTSTTPAEDGRRSLYEIVEDPALLIRGQPVKLTKIFSLFHKAGIEDLLTAPGPTTMFLPSDDAFATLPRGVVEQLEENPELLRQVLLYHVASTEVLPSAGGESYTIPSLEGTQLVITMLNGGRLILISGAKAIAVTRANNGIFYVINQLLYPLPHDNIVGAIQSRPDLSTLAFLLPMSGLQELLQGQAPYTLLAPTDNAFAQLPPAVYDELTKNTTALQEILLNHVIEGAHYGREFLTGATFPSARGGKLKFQVVSYGYQVNQVNIKTPEIVTGTGVIHLVDQVLLEPYDLQFFNVVENSLADSNTPIDNNAPQQPRQPPYPNAPSDRGQTSTGAVQPRKPINQNRPPGQGQPIVGGLQPFQQPAGGAANTQRSPIGHQPSSGHSSGGQSSTFTQPQNSLQPQGGNQQRVPTRQQQPFVGGRRQAVFTPHNQPLSQPNTQDGSQSGTGQAANVADLAKSMGLNRFADWITNTGLLEKIHDGGIYTVFAPTDDAVDALPQEMIYSIGSNPDQMKSLLQYHIVPQRLNLNSISNEESASTLLQGKTIRFNVYGSGQPNCKQLVTASGTPLGDALATMGSVQLIPVTQVLYQPAGNLLNIVDASPILTNLSSAVKEARLTWVLSGTGPVTLFAPSDAAFQSLSEEERRTLIEDKQAFSDLLKRHMMRGTFFSSGIQEDKERKSENGRPMTLSLNEGIMTINAVPVTYSDITATNGVLHVIDQFL